jgi:methyl-accepting chemotaxis protein
MKIWTIGKRITSGFAALLAIAAALGLLAVVGMRSTRTQVDQLRQEGVPQVTLANQIERDALLTMYQMRVYGETEDETYLQNGRQQLSEMKGHVAEARLLGAGRAGLAGLTEAAEKLELSMQSYNQLVEQTVERTHAIGNNRAQLAASAQMFDERVGAYRNEMYTLAAAEAATNASVQIAQSRLKKIVMINQLGDLGDALRVAIWRCQAKRDFAEMAQATAGLEEIKAQLGQIRPVTARASNLKLLDEIEAAVGSYQKTAQDLAANWSERARINKTRMTLGMEMTTLARSLSEKGLGNAVAQTQASSETLNKASWTVYLGLAMAVAAGVVLAWLIIRGTSRILGRISANLELGASQVLAASGEVTSASQSLAEGASEQASSLEETSASLEEMSSMVKRNADNAQRAKELANHTRGAADAGAADMKEMSLAMNEIKASSDRIGKIIKTIDEIAFQTNILALNAAVEAARAGEAGMGFAVVAEEVRALAQRCAQAARETTGNIQDSISKSERGVQISAKVEHSLQEIVEKARQVDELVVEIASASAEQSQGISQVNTAVSQMDKVTQSSAASAEQTASAAEELNAQAETLKGSVAELLELVGEGSEAGHAAAPAKPARLAAQAPARAAAGSGKRARGAIPMPAKPAKPEPKEFETF